MFCHNYHVRESGDYLIDFDIKNAVTEIIEVYQMIRKDSPDAGNSIHDVLEIAVIRCCDEDEFTWILSMREVFQWISEPRKSLRVFVQRRIGNQM